MKKGISIKLWLGIILILLTVMQAGILLISLYGRDFYGEVDRQSIDTFSTRSSQQVSAVNDRISLIVKTVVESSIEITNAYTLEAALQSKQLSEIDISDTSYLNAQLSASKTLLNLMDKCAVDSVYFILNTDENDGAVSVEIKNIYTDLEGDGYSAYQLYTGTSQISKAYGFNIHADWGLKIDDSELFKNYFTQPIKAVKNNQYGTIEQYGYWAIEDDKITYSIPLINNLGQAYGVVGIGITNNYFLDNFVNANDYFYNDSFYAIASVLNDSIYIDETLLNTEYVEENFVGKIPVALQDSGLYYSENMAIGPHLIKIDELYMYSSNSPFLDERIVYLTIIPEEQLHQYSSDIKEIFFIALGITVTCVLIASGIVSEVTTKRIVGLSRNIKKMNYSEGLSFDKTNFREIDELTSEITVLNERVIKSSKTLNHLFELTELNLGGFEFSEEEQRIQVTEYIGKLLDLHHPYSISVVEWGMHYNNLTKNIIDKEKNIYLYWKDEVRHYLKIIQTKSDDGFIGMVLDVTREIEEVMDAKYKLDYDALTKLYSRTAFYRKAEEIIAEDKANKIGLALFIDLDNLKYVNDTYGHDYGDKYLIAGSKLFALIAQNNGIAARMSGDEFAVYLHGFDDYDQVRKMVNDHLESFKSVSIDLPDGTIQRVRFSSGIAWYGVDSTDISDLVKFADFAMYQAKHTMKGTLCEFDRSIYEEKIFMMENTEAINQLIEERLVEFMFQPIVSLKTGEIFAYEALMRSKLEVFKSPTEVLKVATAQFKLKELENMIVSKAIEDAYGKKEQINGAKIFINSITSQIMPEDIFDNIQDKYGDFLKQIVIEITEAEDNTPAKMRQKVAAIKKYGMDIAIDDFGSGYSNELRIIAINPDVVKLDLDLIQGIHSDKDKQVLCTNIITYCHSKDIEIVAEGVEDKEDLQKIIDIGADYVQGFYVLKPNYEIKTVPITVKSEILKMQGEETELY